MHMTSNERKGLQYKAMYKSNASVLCVLFKLSTNENDLQDCFNDKLRSWYVLSY